MIPADALTRKILACSAPTQLELDGGLIQRLCDGLQTYRARLPPAFVGRLLQKISMTRAFAECDEEIQEQLYELLTFFSTVERANPRYSYHFVRPYLDRPIAVRTDDDGLNVLVKDGSTGFRIWEAAKFLLSFLLKNKGFVMGKSVLELGAGTGFVGLGLGISGLCAGVSISDVHDGVLARIHGSIDECDCGQTVEAVKLDWADFSPERFGQHDLIVAADVVYDPTLVAPLASCLSSLLNASDDKLALVCCAVRTEATIARFCNKLTEVGLHWEEIVRTSILDKDVLLESLIYGNEIDSDVVVIKISRS